MNIKLTTIFAAIFLLTDIVPSSVYGSYNYGHGYDTNNQNSKNLLMTNNIKAKTSRGFGISAWGLIVLVIILILLGVGSYYVGIFYPLFCKKQRKYDRIELASV